MKKVLLGLVIAIIINGSVFACKTPEELMDNYSDGKGIEWLLKKRLDGMVNIGLITLEDNKIRLTSFYGKIAGYKTLEFAESTLNRVYESLCKSSTL